MARYHIFYQVHKGLRALLCETAQVLQQTDFTDADEAELAMDRIEEVSLLFDKHAHGEDTVILPAAAIYEPSVADVFAKEHARDHELSQQLHGLCSSWQHAANHAEKTAAGRSIQQAFHAFVAFHMEHMAKEETILTPILWKYYTDQELLAFTQRVIAQIDCSIQRLFNKWMVRGLNNAEIILWVKAVEHSAPHLALQDLLSSIENELPGHRYQQLQHVLSEAAIYE